MPDTAARLPMTIAEFLVWEDGTDTRYELLDGVVRAMAPTLRAHGIVQANLARLIGNALRGGPCTVQTEAGISSRFRRNTLYIADIAVSCTPHTGAGEQDLPDPVLVIEMSSPSTAKHDRDVKLPDYRRIASLREIVLIDPFRIACEVHRRSESGWTVEVLADPSDRLVLDSAGLSVPLADIYEGVRV